MSYEQDQAIVLRLTEYSETSQIVTLFGRDHGQTRLIAKGARRSTKTRFVAGLDLLELGDVSFLPARGGAQLGTMTEWVQRETWPGLRRELLRLQGALYAAELVAGLTLEDDPHPNLFSALVEALHGLAGAEPAAPWITRFQMGLLESIGYRPELDECVTCHRPARGGGLYFSASAGGVVCRDCESQHVEKHRLPDQLQGSDPTGRDPASAGPGHGDPGAWFAVLDYHLTHIAGHSFRTSGTLARLLPLA